MEPLVESIVSQFERGTLSRRQLIATLSGLAAVGLTGRAAAQAAAPTFQATGLNHIALRVTDPQRSRDFYAKHLGLRTASDSASSVFMNFDDGFLALFKGDTPGMDHYCYAIENYDVDAAEETLKAEGLNPTRGGTDRIYFKDPDGLTVQLASRDHTA